MFPILRYGYPVLRKLATEITPDYPKLDKLVDDMWETMYASSGVGLAAPQVNRDIRLFIVDSLQMFNTMDEEDREEYPGDNGAKQVFINARIIELGGNDWIYNEGCLSIPKIREDINRQERVTLQYFDEKFEKYTQTFTGLTARVILHEYDHIEGKLFIDHISAFKRKLLRGKLNDISKGKVN